MQFTLMRARRPRSKGMTLVELMIVSSIVLMLVVISVPVVRPMLMSRKQADAAQILSIYLNSARNRAYETGRDCGVMFERYTDNNRMDGMATVFPNNDSCLVIRQVEVPPPYVGMNPDVRVSVEYETGMDGKVANIFFHRWNGNAWDVNTSVETPYWNNMVQNGDKIQFDNQGAFYTMTRSFNGGPGSPPQISVQDKLPGSERDFSVIRPIPENSPATFKVLRLPKSGEAQLTLAPPVGFPTGIIVDLQYSGIGFSQYWTPPAGNNPGWWGDIESDFKPKSASDNDPVIVMFSPSGAVSFIRSGNQISPGGPIHFLVGRWDRAASDWNPNGAGGWLRPDTSPYPPEDGLRNFQDLSNFWVTIDPNTGRVRTNPVATSDINDQNKFPLAESRRYANQSQ